MVTATDGIPIAHHVFEGNTLDRKTVQSVVKDLKERLKERLGISRVAIVGDRVLLSSENRDTMREAKRDYLIVHPLTRDADSKYLLDLCGESLRQARQEDRRVVLAAAMYAERPDDHFAGSYDPEIAQTSREGRQRRLAKADAAIDEILERLREAKDPTVRKRGRKLTTEGAQLKIHDYLRDHDLRRLYEVRLDESMPLGLSVVANTEARTFEESIDGILIVEGSRREFSAPQMIERSKSLAEIERSWRSLKSTLRLRPVDHWTEKRIRAHVFTCVLALTVERGMRKTLARIRTSVPAALERLERIRVGRATVGQQAVPFLTNVSKPARECYAQLGVSIPRVSDVAALVTAKL